MPFRGESTATIFEAILNRAPTPVVRLNPEAPTRLEEVINKALEKDRTLRYQHASEMRSDLQRLKRDSESTQSVAAYPAAMPNKFLSLYWISLAIALFIAVEAGILFWRSRAEDGAAGIHEGKHGDGSDLRSLGRGGRIRPPAATCVDVDVGVWIMWRERPRPRNPANLPTPRAPVDTSPAVF